MMYKIFYNQSQAKQLSLACDHLIYENMHDVKISALSQSKIKYNGGGEGFSSVSGTELEIPTLV